MKHLLIMLLPWVMSTVSLLASYLDGQKYRFSPLIKFFNQGFWLIWIYVSQNWGFLPVAIAMTIIYARNHRMWTKAHREQQALLKETEAPKKEKLSGWWVVRDTICHGCGRIRSPSNGIFEYTPKKEMDSTSIKLGHCIYCGRSLTQPDNPANYF